VGVRTACSRRNFARLAAASSAVAVASPAIAQQQPAIKWRLASSFPKNLEGLWGADASIMPDCIRANTNTTTIMIGERVADFIKEGR